MNYHSSVLIAALIIITQCSKPEYKHILSIEAENLTLTHAEIISDRQASGGKAVRLGSLDSTGTADITLEPGSYIMTAFENAYNPDQNGFYAGIGDSYTRIYPLAFRQWSETFKFHSFEIRKKGIYKVRIRTHLPADKRKSETEMPIDRLVIKKL
jgi:hypothetical protein